MQHRVRWRRDRESSRGVLDTLPPYVGSWKHMLHGPDDGCDVQLDCGHSAGSHERHEMVFWPRRVPRDGIVADACQSAPCRVSTVERYQDIEVREDTCARIAVYRELQVGGSLQKKRRDTGAVQRVDRFVELREQRRIPA